MSTLFASSWLGWNKVDPGKHTPVIDWFGTVLVLSTMIDENIISVNKTMIITTDRWMIAKRYTKYRGMINKVSMMVVQELNFTIYARWLTKDQHFQDKKRQGCNKSIQQWVDQNMSQTKSYRQRTNKHPQQRCVVMMTTLICGKIVWISVQHLFLNPEDLPMHLCCERFDIVGWTV